MKQLISSLAIASLSLFPSSVLAQHQFGGGSYQPNHNSWQQNQSGGDTVKYDNQILIDNLTPNRDTCDWVRQAARLPCEYFGNEPNSTGYTTHYVGRPRLRWNNQNIHHGQNPGWNNNSGWHNQPWNGGGGGGCLFKQWNKNGGFQVGNC